MERLVPIPEDSNFVGEFRCEGFVYPAQPERQVDGGNDCRFVGAYSILIVQRFAETNFGEIDVLYASQV